MKERRELILLSYLVTQDMLQLLHLWWGVVWSTVYCGAERCAVLSLHPDLVAVKLAWLECLVTGMQSRTARPDPAPLSAHYLTYKPRTSLHHYIHTKVSQARPALQLRTSLDHYHHLRRGSGRMMMTLSVSLWCRNITWQLMVLSQTF